MSQLGTLLWKNFRWCRRHWLWTLMFYIVPILFCGFLLMIVRLISLENLGDCDHVSFALPPSSPAAMIASLVCRKDSDCANTSAEYMPPRQLLLATRMSNTITPENQWTMLCSGLDSDDVNKILVQVSQLTRASRNSETKYADLQPIELVFGGMLLYYPNTNQTKELATLMAKNLDGIDDLKVGAALNSATNFGRIATLASLLGEISSGYKTLGMRTKAFDTREAALKYAQLLNITESFAWGVIGWENVGDDFTYSVTPHYQMRSEVRRSLGFCPQYDIIYPELTVKEHMKFYGDLKGIDPKEVEAYSEDLFTHMKMDHALDKPAGALSGGMKRKLSITISFLGDPATIILDEPTSAIDPFSRRAIWDIVLRYRSKSTVVISTHYMQEADILGDRIAIINHGVLKCSGSNMYLKSKYGAGFYLNLAHQQAIEARKLEKQLKKYIPVSLKSTTDTETTYAVPLDSARSKAMITACGFLEDQGRKMGIASFGISESTMEQVFFNVAADDVDDPHKADGGNGDMALSKIGYENIAGVRLSWLQLLATWIKRFHLTKRSKLGFVFQVLVPLLFTAVMIFLNNVVAGSDNNGERMMMQPWNRSFTDGKILFGGPTDSALAQSVLINDFGTICMGKIPGRTCTASTPTFPPITSDAGVKDCDCRVCPADAAGERANYVQLRGGDQIFNLNQRNATSYMLKTNETNVYASVEITVDAQSVDALTACTQMIASLGKQVSASAVCSGFMLGLDNETTIIAGGIIQLAAIFGNTPKISHVVTAGVESAERGAQTKWEKDNRYMRSSFLNAYNNALLRSRVTSPARYTITLYTQEASLTDAVSVAQSIAGILLGMFSAFALMMPSFATMLVIVNERSSGNKQMQFLMGLSRVAYWFANFVWDGLLYLISIGIVVGFMAIFPDTFQLSLGDFFVIALMFSIGLLLTAYNLSFLIKTARNAILLVGMVVPVFTVASIVLLNWSDESWYNPLDMVLTFFPPYFICISLIAVQLNEFSPLSKSTYSWEVLGKRLAISGLYIVVMILLLIFFEFEIHKRIHSCKMRRKRPIGIDMDQREGKDPDVVREEEDVLNARVRARESVLTVRRLRKTYSNGHTAVKDVTFSVQKGECFGLLGVNGAGKSTLFNMLTGFHRPTAGDAAVLGYSIFADTAKVAKHVSYCPQTDTLFESLTCEEHLFLFARIRGVPGKERKEVVQAVVQEVGLTPHREKQSQSLSGGNKRKLNFAIAMLDFPDVIFLDEMTTGMDPKARRSAWNCLQKAIQMGCAAVITSHSMEECESLCNRLVIMVNGQFRCIGGVQYLKDKFGRYYNMKFRLSENASARDVQRRMEESFPGTQLVEEHLCYVELQCPAEQLKLSHLLAVIHENKAILGIVDFSVSQTTLEHVFVNMVRDQE
uniref:ABC transporter domain-containing protein n=1 Tax=Plectus sambesii TaxID=2011161 RepID=A0A914VMV3_9BILA